MSHELNLALALPQQTVVIAAAALMIVVILALVIVRKSRRSKATTAAWRDASDELGIQFVVNGSSLGHVVRGRVNDHVVSIAPAHRGRKKRVVTQYTVKFEAPEAPKFNLVKRIDANTPIVDTGNPKFDAVVSVQTEQPEMLSRYLTAARRAAILRLLTYFPSTRVTNREAHLLTAGIESEHDKLVDSICHLVASAETFDRPTVVNVATPVAEETPAVAPAETNGTTPITAAPQARGSQQAGGDSDLLTEIRLDEATVLSDLFNSGLDETAVAARFQQVYQGRDVSWTGEVLRVGATERGRQRIAAFVGSADGANPDSGRVVALTAVEADPSIAEGAVVSFSGSLVNLDVAQRLFHVV